MVAVCLLLIASTQHRRTAPDVLNMLRRRVLVLNAAWVPVGTTTVRAALSLLFTTYSDTGEPKSRMLDPRSLSLRGAHEMLGKMTKEVQDVVRTPTTAIVVPQAIVLSRFAKVPDVRCMPRFSRAAMFARDAYRCAYCGVAGELTVEHVTPVARGGISSFENCVAACGACNRRKGNRTPREAGMRLRPDVRLGPPRSSWQRDRRLAECAQLFHDLLSQAQSPPS